MAAHAKYSASGSHRWLHCPGSIALSEKAPTPAESVYAKEGTLAHECLELVLNHGDSYAAFMDSKRFTIAMQEHARDARAWIMQRASELSHPEVLVEERIDASAFTCEGQFGTLDCAIVEEFGTLVVIDYKYGAGLPVEVREHDGELNSQLAYYALGISHRYHHNFSNVEIVVIQPRAEHEDGEIRAVSVTMDELRSWEKRFKDGVEATKKPDALLEKGSWCRFCPAAVICPELKDKAFKAAQIAFSDKTGLKAVPEPKLIPLANLSSALDACERLDEWITRVREHAFHLLQKGEAVEGFKLVNKRPTRRWRDESRVWNLIELSNIVVECINEPSLKSPAQIEAVFKRLKLDKSALEEHIEYKSSGLTMVRESDPRTSRSAIDVFEVIEVEKNDR